MTPEKTFITLLLILIKPFFGFFNSLGNSAKELPINGMYIEIFTYSPFIDSTIQPDPSLNPVINSVQNFLKRFIKTKL